MIWWLAARRAGATLLGLLALSVSMLAVQQVILPAPNLAGGYGAGVQAALAMPAVTASLLIASLTGGDPLLESAATRQLPIIERAYLVAFTVVPLCIASVAALASQEALPAASARNVLGMIGIGLLARPILGTAAAAPDPVAYMLFVAVLGQPTAGARPEPWAWPLASAADRPAALLAGVLFVAGITVAPWRGRQCASRGRLSVRTPLGDSPVGSR